MVFYLFQAMKEAYNKRHHYLLSTAQIPGIYSSQFKPELATKEVELKSARRRVQFRKHKSASSANTTSKSCLNVESSVLPPIGKAAQVIQYGLILHLFENYNLPW